MDKEKSSVWNSLELCKLIVAALIPILLGYLAIRTDNIATQNQLITESNKRIYGERLDVYNDISKEINQIFCYISYVGKWKELSPLELISNKRKCDEIVYSSQILFNEAFLGTYEYFMNTAFDVYTGMGKDAKIKSDLIIHKNYYTKTWNDEWDFRFARNDSYNDLSNRKEIRIAYDSLLTVLIKELNVKERKIKNDFKDYKPQ